MKLKTALESEKQYFLNEVLNEMRIMEQKTWTLRGVYTLAALAHAPEDLIVAKLAFQKHKLGQEIQ